MVVEALSDLTHRVTGIFLTMEPQKVTNFCLKILAGEDQTEKRYYWDGIRALERVNHKELE